MTTLLVVGTLLLVSSISGTPVSELTSSAPSKYVVDIKLTSFEWPKNTVLEDGTKCVNKQYGNNACNPSLDISMAESSRKSYSLGPFGVYGKYTFRNVVPSYEGHIPNAFTFPFKVEDTHEMNDLSVSFDIYNNGNKEEKITEFDMSLSEMTNYPTMNNEFKVVQTVQRDNIKFNFAAKLSCEKDFYGEKCDAYCVARDDETGHYTCAQNGDKICLQGWTDFSKDCLTSDKKIVLEVKLRALKWRQTSENISPYIIVERGTQSWKNVNNKYNLGPFGETSPIEFGKTLVTETGESVSNPLYFGISDMNALKTQSMRVIIYKNKNLPKVLFSKEMTIEKLASFSAVEAEFRNHTIMSRYADWRLKISARSFCNPDYSQESCLLV